MLPQILLAALTTGLALASPLKRREVPDSHQLHERHLPHWSAQWTKRSKVPGNEVLPVRIGLKQSNLDAGREKLLEISTPGSPSFGKHMTPEEVIDFFAPGQATVDAVRDWLVASGVDKGSIGHSVNKQWIQFDATVDKVEELIFAEFHVWEHVSGSHDISVEEYHVPVRIKEHIDYISPGVRLRTRRVEATTNVNKRGIDKNRVKPFITQLPGFPNPNSTTCSMYVTADCTRVQHPHAKSAVAGNEIGIFESLDVHYSRKDLDIYFSTLYPEIPNGTYPEERLIDGAIGAIEDTDEFVPIDLEAPLDFDSAWPLIYPQGLVLFQEDDDYCTYSAYGETGDCTATECRDPVYPNPAPGGYKGALQCGVYKPTNVISISYGGSEAGWPDYYMKRQCDEWMKLSLQGTTIVMSSGDSGVGPDKCYGPEGKIFDPDFASSCPYVLSVGSTEWDRFDASKPPTPYEKLNEVATARFPSGGGFSNVFGIPSYQRAAVDAYFDQVEDKLGFSGYHHYAENGDFSSVKGGVYHHGGRAYPDVAAVGDRQVVYSNGSWWLVGGTSLPAPVFGAVLTLINEARLEAGKSTLGFIHPIIYQHPEAFNDIVSGSNPGSGSPGFPAAKGWDPVTGLGSPNFPVLMKLLADV
ncbi:putative Tripeptidyl-peptidase sed1 [Coniochaeta sp. 2T2.1]|nr:putative Tripeptidyl-peptidase sed1 [Coniochaeta sp. 2T2.1]